MRKLKSAHADAGCMKGRFSAWLLVAMATLALWPATAGAATDVCAQPGGLTGGQLAPYNQCKLLLTGDGGGEVFYSQETIECWTTACRYEPTFHARGEALTPGVWRVEGHTQIRHVSGGGIGGVVAGSARDVSCTFDTTAGESACTGSAANVLLVAGNFNTFYWEGSWTMTFVDATGAAVFELRGSGSGYLAQYFQG